MIDAHLFLRDIWIYISYTSDGLQKRYYIKILATAYKSDYN